MKSWIEAFLASKQLSLNSYKSYLYDLQQFEEVCRGKVTGAKLDIYQAFLRTLKPTAQQRKISCINQFLYFAYEEGKIEKFYKLKLVPNLVSPSPSWKLEEMTILEEASEKEVGRLIALLMRHVGLTPSELALLETKEVDVDFQVLSVRRGQVRRILPLPQVLLEPLGQLKDQPYVFDKKGHPYSRQWFFNQLSAYASSIGKPHWTAHYLREQYILEQLSQGQSLEEVGKQLGLQTLSSLEKYKEHGYKIKRL